MSHQEKVGDDLDLQAGGLGMSFGDVLAKVASDPAARRGYERNASKRIAAWAWEATRSQPDCAHEQLDGVDYDENCAACTVNSMLLELIEAVTNAE